MSSRQIQCGNCGHVINIEIPETYSDEPDYEAAGYAESDVPVLSVARCSRGYIGTWDISNRFDKSLKLSSSRKSEQIS